MRLPIFLLLCVAAAAQTPPQSLAPTAGPLTAPAGTQPATAKPEPVPPDTVVAEVDGRKYTAAQVDELMKLFPPQLAMGVRNDPRRALGYMLMMEFLAKEAEKLNLDKESPVKEVIEFGRINALSQAQMNRVRNVDVKVDLDDEQKFYKEHLDRFQEAKVKVIYVAFSSVTQKDTGAKKPLTAAEAKAKIEALKKQLEAGADFTKLAAENSDDKESAAKGGDFGTIKRTSSYPDIIKKTVFDLKPGQVSEPVLQANGYYLLRLESLTTLPYDQIRTQIYDELKQKGFNDYIQGVEKRFEVKVDNSAYFSAKQTPAQSR